MPRVMDDEYVTGAGGSGESDDDGEEMLSDDADDYRPSTSKKRAGAGRGANAARGGAGARKAGGQKARAGAKGGQKPSLGKDKGYAWEATYKRSWDAVREDEGGSLAGAVRGLLEASKRRRTLHDSAPVQRGIIRHLILILDLSESMNEKDLRPNRFLLTLQYAREFVAEYFDQNPIGQLSILATRDGVAERITSMGGNTTDHIAALTNKLRLQPRGEPSLQNALEMARTNLGHLPSSNSREVLVIFGSLTTCDPSNIHDTISHLARDNVRVSMVCLAAEVKVCKDVCKKTGGKFGVALDESHFRDLVFEQVNPPEIEAKKKKKNRAGADEDDGGRGPPSEGVDLLQMGFPSRLATHAAPTLCACHSKLRSGGYICPRCSVKVCDVPTDCPVCGLTIVMSTHLARSYHHLFPVENYEAVSWERLATIEKAPKDCLGCSVSFEDPPPHLRHLANGSRMANGNHPSATSASSSAMAAAAAAAAVSEANVATSGRYACPRCHNHFCLDCDGFVHENLHLCPGCC